VGHGIVVASIKDGVRTEVERSLRGGFPFGGWGDVHSRGSFVTGREVVFVLSGPDVTDERLQQLADPSRWDSPWRVWIEGSPRVGIALSWAELPEDLEGVSFASTPGPGDSDGGEFAFPP
jgi:hypothetical protein